MEQYKKTAAFYCLDEPEKQPIIGTDFKGFYKYLDVRFIPNPNSGKTLQETINYLGQPQLVVYYNSEHFDDKEWN